MQDRIGPLLLALAQSASFYLDPSPGRLIVSPGQDVVWDECCEGLAWSRLVAVDPGPGPAGPCGPALWVVSVAVGVLRCAAVVDDQGRPPAPSEMTADSMRMTGDSAALAAALLCPDYSAFGPLQIGSWAPVGPEGGCVGGEWAATVRMSVCACPPIPEPVRP